MDYSKCAEELIEYLIKTERDGYIIQGNIAKIAKGEEALIQYLMTEGDGASANQISKRFGVNTSRVAAILNSLSKKGYVERRVDVVDRRRIHVYITEEGKKYGTKIYDEVLSKISILLELLGENDAREFIRLQRKIIDIIHDEELRI